MKLNHFDSYDRNDKECKYCGKSGLHWEELPEGWRLVTSKGQIHSCLDKKKSILDLDSPA